MNDYLVLFLIVLGVNLLPAFGPPTWSIIAIFGLNSDLPVPWIVIIGALAAALGRFILAHAFRRLGRHLPEKQRRNLAAARGALESRRRNVILGLALFALSPIPSAQLFEAAGLSGIRLAGFTTAFFVGRTVSYSIYAVSAKSIRASSLGDAVKDALTSPWGIAIQIAMIALLILLPRIDWETMWNRRRDRGDTN
ncbi:MAG: hypothetical protein KGJ57_20165 [Sphingomonadales bacterium]|nr:hypothetical protein [Sphingomonadales bacterium]MDE2171712.1 hypothetical protein [Sphingomonadales bacterium]